MSETVDIDSVLARIDQECERRRSPGSRPPMGVSDRRVACPSVSRVSTAVEDRDRCTVQDLLRFADEEFVKNAYQIILRRDPDPAGLHSYLKLLRERRLSREEILWDIRTSPEGRSVGCVVNGLRVSAFRARWRRVFRITSARDHARRLLSAAVRAAQALRRVLHSALVARSEGEAQTLDEIQKLLAHLAFIKADRRPVDELGARLDLLEQEVKARETAAAGIQERLASVDETLAAFRVALDDAEKTLKQLGASVQDRPAREELSELRKHVDRAVSRTADDLGGELRQIGAWLTDYRRQLLDQQRQLTVLLEFARRKIHQPFSYRSLEDMLGAEEDRLSALYSAFEDRFRGDREEIKARSRVFLRYLGDARERTQSRVVLDIACGRGELVELLGEQGFESKGVDHNHLMVQECRDRGLDAVETDAISYLRGLEDNSLAAVTCLHFIEHIDVGTLVVLLDETLRVLKRGGVAIFETPNARNLLVASMDFHRDPTHVALVFPDTLEMLGESRGFSESIAYSFNEDRSALIPLREQRFDDLNAYLTVSRDMVWIGHKQ